MLKTISNRICVTLFPQTMEVQHAKAKLTINPNHWNYYELKDIAATSKKKSIAFDLATLLPRVLIGHEACSPISAQKAEWTGYQRHATMKYKPYAGLYQLAAVAACKLIGALGCMLSLATFVGVAVGALVPKGVGCLFGKKMSALQQGAKASLWVEKTSKSFVKALGTGLSGPLRASDKAAKAASKWIHGMEQFDYNERYDDEDDFEMFDASSENSSVQ